MVYKVLLISVPNFSLQPKDDPDFETGKVTGNAGLNKDQLLLNFAEKIYFIKSNQTQIGLNFYDKNSERYLTKQSVRNESFMKFQDICTNLWFISNLHKKANISMKPSVFTEIRRTVRSPTDENKGMLGPIPCCPS
jgi:hypothetical protein